MNDKDIRYIVRIFLIIAPIAWAFRLVFYYNAQIDAIFMLLFSLIIYKNSPNE